jgi:hypothetical protein
MDIEKSVDPNIADPYVVSGFSRTVGQAPVAQRFSPARRAVEIKPRRHEEHEGTMNTDTYGTTETRRVALASLNLTSTTVLPTARA